MSRTTKGKKELSALIKEAQEMNPGAVFKLFFSNDDYDSWFAEIGNLGECPFFGELSGDCKGWGDTAEEAVEDLIAQLREVTAVDNQTTNKERTK